MTKLFFNYSIDCELPPNTPYTEGREREKFFHGPRDWAFADASVRGFVERMTALGVREGASLFVYPDVAREQKKTYRELADAGVETALHLNGMRYSRLSGAKAKWLGAMSFAEQTEAIRTAREDLQETLGRPVTGYRACYGSASRDTFAILEDLGFAWGSNSSGRYRPEFHANWRNAWPYAHHPARQSNVICGNLKMMEFPVTRGLTIFYDGNPNQPLDLRVETPPAMLGGETRPRLREILDENIREMEICAVPVRVVVAASHNTSLYADTSTHQSQNLAWVVRHARELAAEHGLELVPAPFSAMVEEAALVGSY